MEDRRADEEGGGGGGGGVETPARKPHDSGNRSLTLHGMVHL